MRAVDSARNTLRLVVLGLAAGACLVPSRAASMPIDRSAEIPEPGGVAVAMIAREHFAGAHPDTYTTIADHSSSPTGAAEPTEPLSLEAVVQPFAADVTAVDRAPCLRRRVGGSWGDTLSFCVAGNRPGQRGGRTRATAPSPEDVARILADRARALAPRPRIEISPQRVGLTGLPSYFWVERPLPVHATAGIEGAVVVAEARPVQYVWSFEVGAQLVTDHPGAARHALARGGRPVRHTYETNGARTVALEQIWEARWRIGEGAWRVLGYFSVTGVRSYRVREVVPVLVATR